MPRIVRTRQARLDLIQILVDLRGHSPRAADRFETEIEKKCRLFSRFPEMGRAREELALNLRSLVVGKYVLYQRPLDDGIEVVRIVHGARDLPSLFE